MHRRYLLSQFYLHPDHNWLVPVADAYCSDHHYFHRPDTADGWAMMICDMDATAEAAIAQDSRVKLLPHIFDQTPLDKSVTDIYASWAGVQQGMTLAQLLVTLAKVEPSFLTMQ